MMSCTVERFIYQYDKNREACELERDSLEQALDLACEHMEWGQGCPKAIWRQGVLVMNLNQIAKEWMQRHDSKLSHLKPTDQKA
jgi:hypothetical protein